MRVPAGQAASGAASGILLFAAASSWDAVQGSDRHLAEQLSRRLPVLWIDPPISPLSPLKYPDCRRVLQQGRLRQEGPGLLRFTPVTVPWPSKPVLRGLASVHLRRQVRRVVRRLAVPVRGTIAATHADLLDVVETPIALLYGTDDWSAGAGLMGLDQTWLDSALSRQLRKADAVVVVSSQLRDAWAGERSDIAVIPNGCDIERVAHVDVTAPAPDVHLPGRVAGVVGVLSERIDLDYLEATADAGVSLLLIGPRQRSFQTQRVDALLARRTVQWVGQRSFLELLPYLARIDIGLTPYADTAFNRASFPLKTLEYLAAGRPVVATDLPAARWLDTDLISICRSPEAFAAAVVSAAALPRTPALVAARRAFAQQHSWAVRADEIAQVMDLGEPSQASGGGPGRVARVDVSAAEGS